MISDNDNLVNIVCGRAAPENEIKKLAATILDIIAQVTAEINWGPRKFDGEPVQWRRREFNKEADHLANYAMNTKGNLDYVNQRLLAKLSNITYLQGWND